MATYSGTPRALYVEIETSPGVWQNISRQVRRKGVRIEYTFDGHLATAATVPLKKLGGGLDLHEYQRIRISDRTNPAAAYPRYFFGYIENPPSQKEGSSKAWNLRCVGGGWRLKHGAKAIGTTFEIPAFISDKKAIAGGTFTSPTWTASTQYLIGAQRQPTGSPTHYYKCVGEAQYVAWAKHTTYPAFSRIVPSVRNEFYYSTTAGGTSGATEPATWPTIVGATVTDSGGVVWTCHARLGYSGTVEPPWPTDGSQVTDGGVLWKDMGSRTFAGLIPTYLSEMDASFVNEIILSMAGRTYTNTDVEEVLKDIGLQANASQQIAYYVSPSPDNPTHTADWQQRLQWFNILDDAHAPYAQMEFVEFPTLPTHAGYSNLKRQRLARTIINAPTVSGSNGASYSIDPSLPAPRTVTVTIPGGPGTPFFTAAGGHTYVNGDALYLETTGTLPAPFAIDRAYYVRDVLGSTFKLAATPGGAAIGATTTGTGTHTSQLYGAYGPASLSYIAYNNLAVAKAYNDPTLKTNEECRRRAHLIVDLYGSGLDTVTLTSRHLIDPGILAAPRKVYLSSSTHAFDHVGFWVNRVTLRFNDLGVAMYDYELGAAILDDRTDKIPGFRGGQRYIVDTDPPDVPTWAAGTGWVLENVFDEASWTVRLQLQAILGAEGDLYRAFWYWQAGGGNLQTDFKNLSPGQGTVELVFPPLPPDVEVLVEVEALDTSANPSGLSVRKSLTTASVPAVPPPSITLAGSGFDPAREQSYIDIAITPPVGYSFVGGYRRYLYAGGVNSEQDCGNIATDRIYLTPGIVYQVAYRTYNTWGRLGTMASNTVSGAAPGYPAILPPGDPVQVSQTIDPVSGATQTTIAWAATSTTTYLSHYLLYASTDGGATYYPSNQGRQLFAVVVANPGDVKRYKLKSVDRWGNESTAYTATLVVTAPLNAFLRLPNGDFENERESGDAFGSLPYLWDVDETGGMVRIELAPDNVHSGIRALKIPTGPSGQKRSAKSRKVQVTAGRARTLQLYAKSSVGGAAILNVKIHWYSWSGTAWALISTDTTLAVWVVQDGYTVHRKSYTPPPGAKAAEVEIYRTDSNAASEYIDDVTFDEPSVARTRLDGFEPVPATGASAGITSAEVNSGADSYALTITPPPIDPTILSTFKRVYDASTIPPVSGGTALSTWDDSSTSNQDATQSGAARPTYETASGPGGQPYVLFNGSSQSMNFPEIALGNFTIFVAQQTSGDVTLLGHGTKNQQVRFGPYGGIEKMTTTEADVTGTTAESNVLTVPRTQWSVLEYCRSGSTVSFYENGAPLGSGTMSGTFYLNAIGRVLASALLLNGRVAYIGIADTSLSTANREGVTAFLAAKYGVTVTSGTSYTSEALGPETAAVGGNSYSFWGAIKGTVAAGTFTYAVRWYDKTDTLISTSTVFTATPTTSSFVEGKSQLAAPAGTAYFVESVKYVHTAAGTVYFDTIDPKKVIDGKDLHPTLDFTGEMNFKGTGDDIKLWDQDTDQKWIGIIKGLGTTAGANRNILVRAADFDATGNPVDADITADANVNINAGGAVEITSVTGTNISGGLKVGGVAGLSVTVPLAKLTPAGANGQLVFTNGVLTGRTDPT
ncbi:MAG TPA: hypothetical protein VEX13_08690 [Chloroflexia bacterium]|nr:hypothetical protein [Chloroflexia bacterium]